ncbi:MAG TPA: hypothetical protein VIF60_10555 [Burkholderiaceae bacterium]|jgi:hypothetical protein
MVTELNSATLVQSIDNFIKFVGIGRLKQSAASLRKGVKLSRGLVHRYHVAEAASFTWWSALDEYEWGRRPFSGYRFSDNIIALGKDATKLETLLPTMPESVRRKFAGSFGARAGAPAALFEMTMAHHFHNSGYKLEWCEDVGAPMPEFVARKQGLELEVECKQLSIDTGRRVARLDFCQFCDLLYQQLRPLELMGDLHVDVDERLSNKRQDQVRMVSDIVKTLKRGKGEGVFDWGNVTMHMLPDDRALIDFARVEAAHLRNKPLQAHFAMMARDRDGSATAPIAVSLTCRKADGVLKCVYDTLADAARIQLSGIRPGVICLFIPGIEDFNDLAQGSGLEAITRKFFDSENRSHVAGVVYSSNELIARSVAGVNFSTQALAYRNLSCRFPEVEAFRFFTDNPNLPVR